MTRDDFTLPLFAGELLPASPQFFAPAMPGHWPPAKQKNFAWWCQNGNREMCAAVLWRSEGFSVADARAVVTMLHDSPACTHFAQPMARQLEHAA